MNIEDDSRPMPDRPTGFPPILLDIDYPAEASRDLSAPAAVADGMLVLRGGGPGTIAGHPFSADSYRDVVVDASVGLVAGDDADLAGIFVRQADARRYVVAAFSPAGHVYVASVDGGARPVAEGPLRGDVPFERGVGSFNRLTIVTFGPSLVVVLNGAVLVHLAVDERFAAGYAGGFLQQGPTSGEARAAVRWAQVRAVLADQR
jgi:hypothetical protein